MRAKEAVQANLNKNPTATFQELGFPDKESFMKFQEFFVKYLAFNSDVMELLLTLASLTCFKMELAKKSKDTNFVRQLDRDAPLLDMQPDQEQGQ